MIMMHYGLRGGVRNFFNVWCEQTLISHLSGYPKPRSKECPLLGPLLGPPGPKIDQKRVQIAQKRPKSDFEGSGGPKRLERRGTKLERGTGHICWDFQTNWECGGAPNFSQGAPKKGPNGPKMAKIWLWGCQKYSLSFETNTADKICEMQQYKGVFRSSK